MENIQTEYRILGRMNKKSANLGFANDIDIDFLIAATPIFCIYLLVVILFFLPLTNS